MGETNFTQTSQANTPTARLLKIECRDTKSVLTVTIYIINVRSEIARCEMVRSYWLCHSCVRFAKLGGSGAGGKSQNTCLKFLYFTPRILLYSLQLPL